MIHVIVILVCIATSALSEDICPKNNKKDCGYLGIDQKGCEEKGCCWKASGVAGEPWCFYQVTSEPTCNSHAFRFDCGFIGITERDCIDKGCCYEEEEEESGIPWCYHKTEVASSDICREDWPRADCGSITTTEEECLDKGCCWSTAKEGEPWCYYKYSLIP